MHAAKKARKEFKPRILFQWLLVRLVWLLTLVLMAGIGSALVRAREAYLVRKAATDSMESAAVVLAPLPYDKPVIGGKRAAIILDDLGPDLGTARKIIGMGVPVTFAVLPYRRYSYEIATEAARRGKEVILHLPLQPRNYPALDPGPGCLLVAMDRQQIQAELDTVISSLPACTGVSSHMGSLFSADGEAMYWVLSALREKNLFFVDSLVTPDSAARETAGALGVRFASRTHLLDEKRDEALIVKQLCRLADFAAREGVGIGIGHPYPETLAAIPKALPAFAEKGVKLVKASEIAVPLKLQRGEAY